MDIELFDKLQKTSRDIYIAKNKDYGSSVTDTYKKYGLVSFLVRMEDKMNRLRTLSQQEAEVADEKIEDTLMDLANYALLAIIELKRE